MPGIVKLIEELMCRLDLIQPILRVLLFIEILQNLHPQYAVTFPGQESLRNQDHQIKTFWISFTNPII